MSEAIAGVIQTYPGWILFCELVVLAMIKATIHVFRKDLR
jgi:hypothetical protein